MVDDKNNDEKTWVFTLDSKVSGPAVNNLYNKVVQDKLILEELPVPDIENKKAFINLANLASNSAHDFYLIAPIWRRIAAQILDFLVVAIMLISNIVILPYTRNIYTFLSNKTKLYFMCDKAFISPVILLVSFLLFNIVLIIITRDSIGKIIMSLEIQNKNQHHISVIKLIFREIILKPLSIISVIGIGISFFNNDKQTLHDFLSSTIVVVKK